MKNTITTILICALGLSSCRLVSVDTHTMVDAVGHTEYHIMYQQPPVEIVERAGELYARVQVVEYPFWRKNIIAVSSWVPTTEGVDWRDFPQWKYPLPADRISGPIYIYYGLDEDTVNILNERHRLSLVYKKAPEHVYVEEADWMGGTKVAMVPGVPSCYLSKRNTLNRALTPLTYTLKVADPILSVAATLVGSPIMALGYDLPKDIYYIVSSKQKNTRF